MTYQEVNPQYGNSNYLSRKLINQYINRGTEPKNIKSAQTVARTKRVGNVKNMNQYAPDARKKVREGNGVRRQAAGQTARNAGFSGRQKSNVQNSSFLNDAERYSEMNRIKAQRERRAAYERARLEEQRARELAYIKAYEKKLKKEESLRRKKERTAEKALRKKENTELLKREIRVEKQKMSWSFVIILAIVSCMIMGVVFSFSQVYSSSRKLSEAKQTLTELQKTSEELELQLEQKNDIRTIEQQATEKIGMVKEDSVDKKYISLSSGDYIELANDAKEDENTGRFGTMLSSISSAFGDFMDYFN